MNLLLFLVSLLASLQLWAEGISRIQGQFGIGQGTAVSADGRTKFNENPMAFGFAIDHSWTDAFFIYAEHLRSMGGSGTSMGITGIGVKFYPWITPLQGLAFYKDNPEKSFTTVHGYSTYFGGSLGFAQASVPSNSTNPALVAVGVYIGAKAGVEYEFTKKWSLISEFNFAFSLAGSGSVQLFNIAIGAGYAL